MKMWSCEDRSAPFVDVFKRTAEAHRYDLRLIAPTEPAPAAFQKLKGHYRHLSPNPERFELASFRRWFEIAQRVEPTDRFVLADSDLVIALPFSRLPTEIQDFDGLVGSIGATNDILEDGINGGFSVWTGRFLHDFCSYMVAYYENSSDRLATLHAEKISAGNARASISDMTLLYSWVKDSGIPFFNTNRLLRGKNGATVHIDHNFFMPEALHARFEMTLGRKTVSWRDGWLKLRTKDGEIIQAASLHLGGRYKIMADDLERKNQIGLMSKSAYILAGRTARRALGHLGIHR
ncbi:MAG: hypothetical protein HQ446_05750 [Polaromonas sp.]|nr:hypothetical protein [Polaromonas sp.]